MGRKRGEKDYPGMYPIRSEQFTAASGRGRSYLAAIYELSESTALWVERRKYLALFMCSVVYFCFTVPIARRKLMWDDEFFTLYISGAASFSEIWKALLTGADQHPPSFYFLTHTVFSGFGISHLTLRLPAMLGFWLMLLCLYAIVARRTSPIYGLAAMLFPLLTWIVRYATEARGYGLVLGFGSLALLCWLCASDGRRRACALPGLWLSLMLAVGSHYYAILLLLPLGVGELVRWLIIGGLTGLLLRPLPERSCPWLCSIRRYRAPRLTQLISGPDPGGVSHSTFSRWSSDRPCCRCSPL